MKKQIRQMGLIKTIFLVILMSAVFLCGCNTPKKEVERLQVYAVRYPNNFKVLANQLAPCFDGKAKSDTTTKIDTVTIKGDTTTLIITRLDTVFKTVRVQLPGKVINKTVTIRDTIADGRAVGAVQAQLNIKSDSLVVVKTQLITEAKNSAKFQLWFYIAAAIIAVFFTIKVYSFISGGGIKSLFNKK